MFVWDHTEDVTCGWSLPIMEDSNLAWLTDEDGAMVWSLPAALPAIVWMETLGPKRQHLP